jgi:hypothetical protein
MGSECGAGNDDKARLAQINKEPINGYKLYILNCINVVENKTSLKGELLFYRVVKGQERFYLGNGFGEPYCIPTVSIAAKDAVDLKKYTGLPSCSGYYEDHTGIYEAQWEKENL